VTPHPTVSVAVVDHNPALRRTLPRAVGRSLAAAGRGRGVAHALRAGSVLAGVGAAGFGGAVESLVTARARRSPRPAH
jgi:hypothetical protein